MFDILVEIESPCSVLIKVLLSLSNMSQSDSDSHVMDELM